ncbi:asparaginase [Paenibacillus senegalensis]|uniref:asparaginase n=1 Tax=Paenibacillus senegalensis TaxID=1465766 RepID=UPI000288A2A2|nr:asparaginase [Paenibacillus senegalensis]
MNPSSILIQVLRGQLVESRHTAHLAIVNEAGRLLYECGDPHLLTFIRSSAKPLQALPVVETGAASRYRFGDRELALICSSHNGEPAQVQLVEEMLARIGLSAAALQCGVQKPAYKPAADELYRSSQSPGALHNTCSGKHGGMLALSQLLGADHQHYTNIEHPVQQIMLKTVAEMSGTDPASIPLGVDGCGVPVFGLHLTHLAYAYARWGRPERLSSTRAQACRSLIAAITAEPYYLAGSERYDTRLVEVTQGKVIGKMGAEGVFALTLPDKGWGLALKITDGSERALYPAVTEVLRQLGALNEDQCRELSAYHQPLIKNKAGTVVGRIEAQAPIREVCVDLFSAR